MPLTPSLLHQMSLPLLFCEFKKKKSATGQKGLWPMTWTADRSGSKPISPIPMSIPMTQILDLVILSDISLLLIWYGKYYNSSQHFLLEIESLLNISTTELISHNRIMLYSLRFRYFGFLFVTEHRLLHCLK